MITLSIQIRTHPYAAIIAAIVFVYNLVDAQRESARRERQRSRVQALLARAEMDALRSRLQPRFAVRMLRHIAAVVREQPNAADSLIVTLSGILRRSMARGSEERIPLADELEHLDRCLDLCRAGGGLLVDARYVADDEVLACRVPALVLQPAIESVVVDLIDRGGGSVDVRCARQNGELRIEVGPAVVRVRCAEAVS
jgi:LytS/YehU family sensor histidine kinase